MFLVYETQCVLLKWRYSTLKSSAGSWIGLMLRLLSLLRDEGALPICSTVPPPLLKCRHFLGLAPLLSLHTVSQEPRALDPTPAYPILGYGPEPHPLSCSKPSLLRSLRSWGSFSPVLLPTSLDWVSLALSDLSELPSLPKPPLPAMSSASPSSPALPYQTCPISITLSFFLMVSKFNPKHHFLWSFCSSATSCGSLLTAYGIPHIPNPPFCFYLN